MRLKLFIFDLDGTLIDSYMDIGMCVNMVLHEMGRDSIDPEKVRAWIGGGARNLLEKLFSDEELNTALELFRRFYREHPVVHTKTYEGVQEVLAYLRSKGSFLAVVTNKMEDLSREILRRLKLLSYFDIVVGGDTFPEKKPSPLPIKQVMEQLKVCPQESIIVGDTSADICAGKGAGIWTALARWGYVRLDSVIPDFFLSEPKDIISLL